MFRNCNMGINTSDSKVRRRLKYALRHLWKKLKSEGLMLRSGVWVLGKVVIFPPTELELEQANICHNKICY
jgi:hypothetical protein